MFEWKTLRTFAVLLIALPVIQLVYSLSTGLAQYVDPSPEAWAEELERIIEADTKLSLPEKPILVVGGQRVRLWRDLNEALAPQPTLLRPLGDATIDDLTFHYDRLIGHYRPDTLVIVPGYSDLHLRDSKSPEAFLNAVSELLALDTEYGYTRMRILMTPILMPLHPGDAPRIRAMATAAQTLASKVPNLVVLDPNSLLVTADGRPNPDYYMSDGINLNNEGYARITLLLEQAIESMAIPSLESGPEMAGGTTDRQT